MQSRMTRTVCRALCALVLTGGNVRADEPVVASPSPSPTVLPPAAAAPRSVRISFVPPPLEGTISLGIYDSTGKLVRVLHKRASLEAFTVGADALITKWDGKDDHGVDLPAGKYHARGYAVGPLQVENAPDASPASSSPPDRVPVKLTPNPLVKNDQPNVEVAAGFDDTGSFLKTADDLPLFMVSERLNISHVAMAKTGDKSVDVWQDSGAGREHFRISQLDQMMAFDCGSFDLK